MSLVNDDAFDGTGGSTADGTGRSEPSHDGPPGLMEMFINSTDTLRHRHVVEKIPEAWNDRPPLFEVHVQPRARSFLWRKPKEDETLTEQEDPKLLKGMIRKGIPPPLRCAVWLSNIVQSSHPDQDLGTSHDYRTLAKVCVVDGLYDGLWEENADGGTSANDGSSSSIINISDAHNSGGSSGSRRRNATTRIRKQDVTRMDFGNDAIWKTLDAEGCPGIDSLERVLYALHKCVVGGIVDYAPLLPTLASILLGFMSESYAFYACREMYHQSTWYWATSRMEFVATQRAFADILGRLHQQTYNTMQEQEATKPYTKAIFQDFFTTILPDSMVPRLMDIYTLEGSKVLFRFGVALAVLYGKEYKDRYMYASTDPNKWWLGLVDYCHDSTSGEGLDFEVWVKKAYGVHGKGVRKRLRFPRRPILARIIEMEQESYGKEQLERRNADGGLTTEGGIGTDGWDDSYRGTDYLLQVEPLGLVAPPPPSDPDQEPVVARLAEPTLVRTKLAEWMPLSLRFSKLDLVYSSSHHGRTLERLYQHISKSTHTILILEPYDPPASLGGKKVLIGMYASQAWHPSRRVYGDGRCFLFRIVLDGGDDGDEDDDGKPKQENGRSIESSDDRDPLTSKCWKWRPPDLLDFSSSVSDDQDGASPSTSQSRSRASSTALLETFQVSTDDFMSMGGDEHGGAGLRLNEDLTKGESTTAAGFNNEPLLPGAGGMFEVGLVEVYQLVRYMDEVPIR